MEQIISQFKNFGKITYLEFRWGLRIPESIVYNFLAPALILVLLSLVRSTQEYLNILVPGMIGLVTASSAMQGVGTTVSFMRAYGSWRTLRASPIPSGLYFLGLIGSRLVRTLLITGFMLLTVVLLFSYRVEGSVALTFAYVLLGGLVFSSLGLVVAYLVRSPQAVSGAMNLVLLPMLFTSDVLYLSHNRVLKTISLFLPLTYLTDLLRSNARGEGLGEHGLLNLGVLAGWFVICSWVALKLAERRVEEE